MTIFDRVQAVLTDSLHCSSGQIDPEKPLEEYGLDSLGAVSLVCDLEDEFGVSFDDGAHPVGGCTVDNVHKMTARQIAEAIQKHCPGEK
jgi:acyl carrier protein